MKGTHHPALFTELITTQEPHWISEEPEELKKGNLLNCDFRFQHQNPYVSCTVYKSLSNKLIIRLEKPLRAITEGQVRNYTYFVINAGDNNYVSVCCFVPRWRVLGQRKSNSTWTDILQFRRRN